MWKVKLVSDLTSEHLVIGKKWLKKNIKESDAYPSSCGRCNGTVYGLPATSWKTPEGTAVFLCIDCGLLQKSAPKMPAKKPQVTVKKDKAPPAANAKKAEKPIKKAQESQKAVDLKVSEIKGVGKATAEQLAMAGIHTAADLLALDSKTIAAKIGRKSDTQVKKWIENAKEAMQSQ
ncbi:MAG: helix-hairpin-helix domain-containing protein [Candidatus Odinarchaeota archaeon]